VIPELEGWYTDPWGHHEARWISGGVPTKLVRDGKLESYDDPPDSPPNQTWAPIDPPPGSVTAADTLRADALEAETMPSLAEISRREDSAALTARAHPWFIARDWVPSSTAEAISTVRRDVLIGGGVTAGLIVMLSTYLWVVLVIDMLTPPVVQLPRESGCLLDGDGPAAARPSSRAAGTIRKGPRETVSFNPRVPGSRPRRPTRSEGIGRPQDDLLRDLAKHNM
jgi:hypothetical protein